MSALVALAIGLHLLGGAAYAVSVGVTWLDLTSVEQYLWFFFGGRGRANRLPPIYRKCRPGRDARWVEPGRVTLGVDTMHPRWLGSCSLLAPATRRARPRRQINLRPAGTSTLAGHLVHLAPSPDSARGGAETPLQRGQCTRFEVGARGEPVTFRRQRVDLGTSNSPSIMTAAGVPSPAERPGWQPGSCRSGCPSAWPPSASP